ncbi:MAG: T9SS type A sorting domain-containing protein, partial [Bacteroidota bacterium]
LLDTIETRYGAIFNDLIDGEEVNRERIQSFLQNLLDHQPVEPTDCNPGNVWFTNPDYMVQGEDIFTMMFYWDGPVLLEEYFGAYLDLRTNEEQRDSLSNRPGMIFYDVVRPAYKLIALNGRCTSRQSGFFIIIVEKDLTLQGMYPPGGLGTRPAILLREASNQSELQTPTELLSKGNPTSERIQLSLHLATNQVVSLQVFHSSSGQLMHTFVEQSSLSEGNHFFQIPIHQWSSGMYYAVFQSTQQRIVQKIMVVH